MFSFEAPRGNKVRIIAKGRHQPRWLDDFDLNPIPEDEFPGLAESNQLLNKFGFVICLGMSPLVKEPVGYIAAWPDTPAARIINAVSQGELLPQDVQRARDDIYEGNFESRWPLWL